MTSSSPPTLNLVSGPLADVEADLLVVTCAQDETLSGKAAELDSATDGLVKGLVASGSFKGRAYQTEWIFPAPLKSRRVLLLGSGKAADLDLRTLRRLAAAAVRHGRGKKAGRICLAFDPPLSLNAHAVIQALADGAVTGLADSDLYKDQANKGGVSEVSIWTADTGEAEEAALQRGLKIAEQINFGRWLGDEPSNVMSPERVADEVSRRAEVLGVKCTVLDEDEIRAGDMRSLLSVSQGSARPPRVVVLEYRGGANEAETLAFVGKGVTFDTGGISIKPAADMHYMKYDMCGAAAAVSAVFALASIGAKVNVLGVVGLVENMPSGTAMRPGDVVRAANGKSIEIINTDAEGRLVLADVLDLARKRGANKLVDIATLTGAIKVALGTAATGAMGSPQTWVDTVVAAADRAGERLWPLPIFPEYLDQIKSNIADVMNTGGRYGGALTAGAFLQQFVGDTPWVHLDVAGTAWTEKDSAWQMKGATGSMIRTLIELADPAG
ncbi:MAG TPA: leucyl aminopeptidase [Chloroflexia bacterium]|nr:leucyl aminopeptidase [Chloroflexia bacterium]